MPVSYDFNQGDNNRSRYNAKREKRLRFLCILGIVAAITVTIVMIISRNGNAETNVPSAPSADVDKNVTGLSGGETVVPPSGGTGKEDLSGKNSGKSGGTGKEDLSGKNGGKSGGTGENSGVRPPEYVPGKAGGAKEVLAQIAKTGDPDEIIRIATAFLMKEHAAGGEFSADWRAVGEKLSGAVRAKWQLKNWKKEAVIYRVVARDNLTRISVKNHSTISGIKYLNNKKKDGLSIGEKLQVLPGPWRITVSGKAQTLNVWRKDVIFAVLPVAVGVKYTPPVGKWKVLKHRYHYSWVDPEGRQFKYGDPDNPLGDHALEFRQGTRGHYYAIHGVNNGKSAGRAAGNICIQLSGYDAAMLFNLVPDRTPVEVVD